MVPLATIVTNPAILRGASFIGTVMAVTFLGGATHMLGMSVGARISRKLFRTEIRGVSIVPREADKPVPPAPPAAANDASGRRDSQAA
jgi:hypothetical protein